MSFVLLRGFVNARRPPGAAIAVAVAALQVLILIAAAAERSRRVAFADLPVAVQQRLHAGGITEQTFGAYVRDLAAETARRVAEGEREHFIYYALQSTRFTSRPRIEPALSAKAFVEGLPPADRRRFVDDPAFVPSAKWPSAERARVAEALAAAVKPSADARLASFRQLSLALEAPKLEQPSSALGPSAAPAPSQTPETSRSPNPSRVSPERTPTASPARDRSPSHDSSPASEHARAPEPSRAADALFSDYLRIVRFLYRKEFVAESAPAVASLYQTRPHSSDTQVEAGFGVYTGLGALHGLAPAERIRRVLIVGPGLDLAPRTDLVDVVDPQSYQPFAVADALIALSMASESDLRVHSIDVNPRVVDFVQSIARDRTADPALDTPTGSPRTSRAPFTLHVFSGVAETRDRPFSPDYASYLRQFGRSIGEVTKAPTAISADTRYRHSVTVRPAIRHGLTAERLDIITERLLGEPPFDLVVVTNVLPYFDDRQLALALANITALLRPSGFLLHNESRAGLPELATAIGLPVLHMRTAVIGGRADHFWYDSVWLHRKN